MKKFSRIIVDDPHEKTSKEQKEKVKPWFEKPSMFTKKEETVLANTWNESITGQKIDFLDFKPETVRIEDLVRGMAMTCRYGGQVERFYSVAEHCCNLVVFSLLNDLESPTGYNARLLHLNLLLHDAAEAYVGDIVTPIKYTFCSELRELEDEMLRIVHLALGIEYMENRATIKEYDMRIRLDERKVLQPNHNPKHLWDIDRMEGLKPLDIPVYCLDPVKAEKWWLSLWGFLSAYA